MPRIVIFSKVNKSYIHKMKKISILVPCCNVEKYIRECLESIRVQTHTNIEVICINDGSTDGTGDIIDEYVASDARFKVIHKPNSGYGDSMNKGLEAATGDYIGIVESDDWIDPNMYEVLYQTAEAENRSITQQTIYLLTKALQDETCKNKLRRTNILCQIKEMNLSVADQAPSYESLIREDRDRDEGGIL